MNDQVISQLLSLNKEFYSSFASEFSDTRRSARVNLEHIVSYFSDGVKVLDIGCGNGRLAERLDRQGLRLSYLGIDAGQELITIAAQRGTKLQRVRAEFRTGDVTLSDWLQEISAEPFEVVIALAVLHHIPSYDLRKKVLHDVRTLLSPRGVFIMTNWQFERNERLRKKIVPWSTVGVDEREVEPGDALISWKRAGIGYRYCHLFTEEEVQRMAAQSEFRIVEQFSGDAGLNLYSILAPS